MNSTIVTVILSCLFLQLLSAVLGDEPRQGWGNSVIGDEPRQGWGSSVIGDEPRQGWGYVDVRPGAKMFWWLYHSPESVGSNRKPLVIWLQGGPGASSTGFGNFAEIGPLDETLNARNHTWLNHAHLLFIDNPVGTGYSYVTDDSAYVTHNEQIALDLITLMKEFLAKTPEFSDTPLYIFGESYGGKMVATFALHLNKAIKEGSVRANLKGVAFGDSWISPIDSTETWGQYLYALSLIDSKEVEECEGEVRRIRKLLKAGRGREATSVWLRLEDMVEKQTNGINWYNILQDDSPAVAFRKWTRSRGLVRNRAFSRGFHRHVKFLNDPLDALMNGAVKRKLNIPSNVTWGGQSAAVFNYLSGDFMNPVVEDVELLLNSTDLKITVYTGQLDLIVDSIGTENWVHSLRWPGMENFIKREKEVFNGGYGAPRAFVKREKNFSFYWILRAGHMIPSDAATVAVEMLKDIISS